MNAAAKKVLLQALGFAGSAVNLPKLVSMTGYNLFLPFYHAVGEDLSHIRHLYSVRSAKQFTRDLEYFLKYFEPLDIAGLYKMLEEGIPKNKRFFHISFDDGLSEVYNTAYPILKEKGIPFTLFINPAFVGNTRLFYPHKASLILDALESKGNTEEGRVRKLLEAEGISYASVNAGLRMAGQIHEQLLDEAAEILGINFKNFLRNSLPYMSLEEIARLRREGVSIGAHSMDHPLYNRLSLEEQIRQTIESIAYVQENFKERYRLFSFPFTDSGVGKDFFNRMHDKSGPLADITFGCAGLKKEAYPFHLQRVPMEAYETPAPRQIRARYVYCLLQKMIGKDKIRRR